MIPLGRRTILRGLGGAAIALPWLEAMELPRRVAHAEPGRSSSGFPKRYVAWATCNGLPQPMWKPPENLPVGSHTTFTLGTAHKPLESFKKDLVVIAGLDNAGGRDKDGNGDTHSRGMSTMLSGIAQLCCVGEGSNGGSSISAGGITLDQEIVKRLSPDTKLPSLELVWQLDIHTDAYTVMSYLGPHQPLAGEQSPQKLFSRIFGNGTGTALDQQALARIAAERRSILDAVGKTYQGLAPKLGLADRDKIESHLTQIRDLEKRIAIMPATFGTSCTPPSAVSDASSPLANARAELDLLAMAIACDLTRVGSMQWSYTTSQLVYSWLGVRAGHHALSHDQDEVTDSYDDLVKISTWHAGQLAYFAGLLKGIKEGDGTALDNTLIHWVTDLARGNNGHTVTDIPNLLLGRAGGAIDTGRYVVCRPGSNNNPLFVSILNAFDIPAQTFGDPTLGKGPLPGL